VVGAAPTARLKGALLAALHGSRPTSPAGLVSCSLHPRPLLRSHFHDRSFMIHVACYGNCVPTVGRASCLTTYDIRRRPGRSRHSVRCQSRATPSDMSSDESVPNMARFENSGFRFSLPVAGKEQPNAEAPLVVR
jgi:hypothetical protein